MANRERSGWIAERVASARADAERIAAELVRAGRLTTSEATALSDAVDQAIERGRALIGDALHEPQRIFESLRGATAPEASRERPGGAASSPADASAAAAASDASARIAALEARVAALEAALGTVLASTPGGQRRGGDADRGDG